MTHPDPFELYAIRYGHHSGRKASDNFIGADTHESGEDLDYFVWVARNADRCFVIDTGFNPTSAAERGRTMLRRPAEGVGLLGIDPGAVDEVILTHLHYDHAGSLGDFPRARFHCQDSEVAYATGRCMCHPFLRHPYDVEDVVGLVRRVHAGAVTFHDGAAEIVPGLSLHRIGGHSAGLQVVRVWTRRGWVVVASDATHFYANMATGRPFPAVHDVGAMLEGFRTVRALADSQDHVVPGHDPRVMALYPAVSPDLDGIAVRLDVAPRTGA
ncbi:N-acyl homoserine lactonase family protein [uncultured Methylobacterium sp.]|jgi:glyoxylase-like metal-dependent hydrolase (beta-lactamase superfamily II)|uniref:N-acyl homoserine lactonase family protein n=1 Tax=uncultured Methylobacterium sp. TaxID=157278 RepID=UPI002626F359|nr:N-acyl homoserine lactonase family protein [uncultured Methylobacterium sp.]